jgi:hypothetical protein
MSFKEILHNTIYLGRYESRNASAADRLCSWVKRLLSILVIAGFLMLFLNYQFQSVLELLRTPNLPRLQTLDDSGKPIPQYWPQQNWGGTTSKASADTQRYHHLSQGTATLPMPYDWFMSLEKPDASLWATLVKSLFFVNGERLSGNDYLLRFGFIRDEADPKYNPDGLPIGFTKTESLNFPGLNIKAEGVGFTCAACHTGHFIAGNGGEAKEYIIEGGSATTDLGQLTAAITASLGQTGLSSKIPFFDGRFDRFSRKVLGTQYSAETKAALSESLANVIQAAQKTADIVKVQEGFTRLDALNRIGNQVFSKDIDRRENYQAIDAPVNYPFIWTSSWFKWVQYDGSIMRPLVRNVGESMGVTAHVSMLAAKKDGQFQSSVPLQSMVWIESFLKGKAFNEGLKSPTWPFKAINENDKNVALGKTLYQQHCQGCHLPVVTDPELSKYLNPIGYMQDGQMKYTQDKVLDLVIVKQKEIGTDPAQGDVLLTRLVNTAGNNQGTIEQNTKALGVSGIICAQNTQQAYENQLFDGKSKVDLIDGIHIKDGGNLSFAFALGAIVDQTINAWFDANFISDPTLRDKFYGGRPNCLQAGQGYKARPLNGVWSTAPFLHNGSVATLKDLICKPQEQRPPYLLLGDIRFDNENLGLLQPNEFTKTAKKYRAKGSLYTDEGYFILDTSIPGNSNQGHSFSNEFDPAKKYSEQKKGVIGPKFKEEECTAILDYIKTF